MSNWKIIESEYVVKRPWLTARRVAEADDNLGESWDDDKLDALLCG